VVVPVPVSVPVPVPVWPVPPPLPAGLSVPVSVGFAACGKPLREHNEARLQIYFVTSDGRVETDFGRADPIFTVGTEGQRAAADVA